MADLTDPKREAVARIIDPEKWAVLDSYLADMLRKYKGQNIGYDPEPFKDRASLAKADAILALGSADGIDIEAAAWDWLNKKFGTESDDPVDRAYAADELVDAFHAGRAALTPKPADGDALIAEAARLIAPGEGEAVFYIRVGGEYSQMNVKAAKGVEPAKLLQDAIHVLKAEFDDLSNCPVHTPLPTPAVEALREALEGADKALNMIVFQAKHLDVSPVATIIRRAAATASEHIQRTLLADPDLQPIKRDPETVLGLSTKFGPTLKAAFPNEHSITRMQAGEALAEIALDTLSRKEISNDLSSSNRLTMLGVDEARYALFDAIRKIKIGNATDDKLILDNLRDAGFWICELPADAGSGGEG